MHQFDITLQPLQPPLIIDHAVYQQRLAHRCNNNNNNNNNNSLDTFRIVIHVLYMSHLASREFWVRGCNTTTTTKDSNSSNSTLQSMPLSRSIDAGS